MVITETWCSSDMKESEFKDRDFRGGGVLLAFSESLAARQLTSPTLLRS